MLRVLIADDSALAREILATIVNEDPEMMVAGAAVDGEDAIRKAGELRPNLVTMDLLMPDMDGVEATRRIMAKCPTPIVLVSSAVTAAADTTHFDALAAGAVDVVEKPDLSLLGSDRRTRRKFIENLKAMSSVVTVTRRGPREGRRSSKPPSGSDRIAKTPSGRPSGLPKTAKLVVLGASTGGPPAVARVLSSLSESSPPVVLVQHMSTGFIRGYAEWLDAQVPARVTLAVNGARLAPGHVYVAPDDHHVEVTPYGRLLVYQGPPLRYHRPSVDVLLRSAATTHGKSAVGILLTGMGDDGARGMEALHRAGCFTIAQSMESCVVDGMPAAARDRGAVSWSADCDAMANALRDLRSELDTEGMAS